MKILIMKSCVLLGLLASLAVGIFASIGSWYFVIGLIGTPIGEFLAWIPSIVLGISSAAASLYTICALLLVAAALRAKFKTSLRTQPAHGL